MSAERASLADPGGTRGPAHHQQMGGVSGTSAQLRIAELPAQTRAQRLLELAFKLLKEAEMLARDKSFSEETARIHFLDFSEGIDFYEEVQRFEVGLIKRALEETSGNQAQAAKLLRIKPTTLNSKIKLYHIEY